MKRILFALISVAAILTSCERIVLTEDGFMFSFQTKEKAIRSLLQ